MGSKKKCPEPFERAGSRVYCVTMRGCDGSRRNVSAGETRKEDARDRMTFPRFGGDGVKQSGRTWRGNTMADSRKSTRGNSR